MDGGKAPEKLQKLEAPFLAEFGGGNLEDHKGDTKIRKRRQKGEKGKSNRL